MAMMLPPDIPSTDDEPSPSYDWGWLLHICASIALGAVIFALYAFKVVDAWAFTLGFGAIFPLREAWQHGFRMFKSNHVIWEWAPPVGIIMLADILGRMWI